MKQRKFAYALGLALPFSLFVPFHLLYVELLPWAGFHVVGATLAVVLLVVAEIVLKPLSCSWGCYPPGTDLAAQAETCQQLMQAPLHTLPAYQPLVITGIVLCCLVFVSWLVGMLLIRWAYERAIAKDAIAMARSVAEDPSEQAAHLREHFGTHLLFHMHANGMAPEAIDRVMQTVYQTGQPQHQHQQQQQQQQQQPQPQPQQQYEMKRL